MEDELEVSAEPEQPTNEISTDAEPVGTDQPEGSAEGEAAQEFDDIVLAGQDEPQESLDPRNKTDHILNRVIGRKNKLQDENVRLRQQLEQRKPATQQPQAPALQSEPDEDAFDTRADYLREKAVWQRQMLTDVVTNQINQQQNGHRIAAQQQEDDQSLRTYAENAAKLKVSDFNEMQDKAFDVLGDEFAQLIARQLPDDAPKLMYWLGKNPNKAAGYRDEYQLNPGKTTFSLGKLAGNLTVKSTRTKAADPESRIDGASSGGGNDDWQRQYSKIMDSVDVNNSSKAISQIRALKSKAKSAGYDVSTLK